MAQHPAHGRQKFDLNGRFWRRSAARYLVVRGTSTRTLTLESEGERGSRRGRSKFHEDSKHLMLRTATPRVLQYLLHFQDKKTTEVKFDAARKTNT
ncbi:hypothetical protein E2C01_041028 [Portunus trituberculatus]|uniref:Uncharacterized protein n=1 Tax=Portunus trituberculatus TaxID=210409 RepID=A0A5B7FPK5_PORTR|nr:hypothetical protein [Portunus trituberculatus]